MSVLGARLVAVHGALEAASIPHAFGGAIALAYCTEEPRGTRDIDVNVFVAPDRVEDVFAALPHAVVAGPSAVAAVRDDGQVRLWWDDTPVDVFFDVHDFHREVASSVRVVPFGGTTIPVLGCTALAVFKVVFNRTKDWADLEAMVEAGALDEAVAIGWAVRLFGLSDERVQRLVALWR